MGLDFEELSPGGGAIICLGAKRGRNRGTKLNPQLSQGFNNYHYLSFKNIICKKAEKWIELVAGAVRNEV
jgi:hypothetical protein